MIWAFDVDGTLIGSIRSDRLRPGTTELLQALADRGISCVLWSAGGHDYAERKANEHHIAHLFTAFYSKDRRDELARYLVDHFAAAHEPTTFVDDAPGDLPVGARVIGVSQFMGGNDADQGLCAILANLDAYVSDVA
jgi:cation transport ATPase